MKCLLSSLETIGYMYIFFFIKSKCFLLIFNLKYSFFSGSEQLEKYLKKQKTLKQLKKKTKYFKTAYKSS